jgi:ribosomal protein S18 acetylase RimI-like enzyme
MSKPTSEKVKIREAIEADAERIHEIQCDSVRKLCSAVYSPEIIDGWLKNRTPEGYLEGIRRGEMYTAELNRQIIGFGHAILGEILATFVDPAYARRGVGMMLMRHGLKIASVNTPRVIRLEATLNSRLFYEALGFKVVREIKVRRGNVEIPALEMEIRGADKI